MSWIHDQERREKWIRFVQSLSPDIDPKAVSLMDEVGFVSRAIYHVGEQSLDGAGLSTAQYRVLMHLFFAESMGDRCELNPSEISQRQGVSRNSMSALIRNLENEGLVERRLDLHDRRRFDISLTGEGRSLVTDYARQHLATLGSCFSVLTPAEQETLSHLLRKVRLHLMAVRQQV
jgi:DNA-binding MarR family transcriptional regulator